MTAPKIDTYHDPVLRRYRSVCPLCGYQSVRAKREAAVHIVSQHLSYSHDVSEGPAR